MTLLSQTLDYLEAKDSEHEQALMSLLSGELTCLVIRKFIKSETASTATASLIQREEFVDHDDVPGLKVLGLSHFQAVRTPHLFQRYSEVGAGLEEMLENACRPLPSPFGSLKSYLAKHANKSIEILELENEPPPAPFTVRSCGRKIGIEPHQDILLAESPKERIAASFSRQLAANIFLAGPDAGGELEIFELGPGDTGYKNLEDGPKTIAEDQLPSAAITVSPRTGDLVMFDSTMVHIVHANQDPKPRVTLACFIASQHDNGVLYYWV
ncbi:putative 2OG-Fe(II) oxygenase (plasmid) [Aliisedimentitalea scapharcae]|uniref:2OG-Fe(II) oxygenase n=1 Tax=Aliisedimentitalea scapharcae TaxID=1524259 RepID=A0ABZ2Y1P7_9RHOB